MRNINCSILGISPGNKQTGFAILKNNELVEWGIKTFNGKWSKTKLMAILECLEDIIERYKATGIVVKKIDDKQISFQVEEIIKGLKGISSNLSIPLKILNLSEIKEKYLLEQKPTKKNLVEEITRKYPELLLEYKKENKNLNSYYLKLFEAVALASIYD